MIYILMFLLLTSIYTLSYIRHCWNHENEIAAVGSMFLLVISISLSVFVAISK